MFHRILTVTFALTLFGTFGCGPTEEGNNGEDDVLFFPEDDADNGGMDAGNNGTGDADDGDGDAGNNGTDDMGDDAGGDDDAGDDDMGDDDAGGDDAGDDDAGEEDAGDDFDPLQVCLADCDYSGDRWDEVDCDYDGLSNYEEDQLGTDPCDNDTDGDGLPDLAELQEGTDPHNADSDGDGLEDADELFFGFDPNNPDSLGDGKLDGDRWVVSACDNPASEPVNYFKNSDGDWHLALPPAFSNYLNLVITGAQPKDAAAVYDDPANEVAGFLLSADAQASDTAQDFVRNALSTVSQAGALLQDGTGGEFDTHDFHRAAIGRYLIRTSSPKSARQVRDDLLEAFSGNWSLSDIDQSQTPLPNTAGAEYREFRVFVSATYRESQQQGYRKLFAIALAPAQKYETREKVKFRMDDLTNTTNVASSGDDHKVNCTTFRAGEGNPEADFYWVLDASGSMNDDFARVKSVANQFFTELNNTGLDYRLGVVPTDIQIDGRVRFPPGWHKDVQTFRDEIDDFVIACQGCGTTAGYAEWGLTVAKDGITWMKSSAAPQNVRIRANAQLVTIFMSDEEAQSIQDDPLSSAAGQQKMTDFKNFFVSNGIIAFAIVGDGSGCGSTDGEAYRQVALASGGGFASLCASDISETIQDIIFAATGLASNYVIPDTPISSTLRVFKNGEWVPRSRENGFDYFATTNSVAFFGTYRPEPADPTMGEYGDDIAVSYQTFVDTTKD